MTFLDSVPWLRAISAVVLVFFAPGFAWTLVLCERISVIERIVFSFAISIAAVTLCIFAFGWLPGTTITGTNSLLIILAVTGVPLAVYFIRAGLRKRGNLENETNTAPGEK